MPNPTQDGYYCYHTKPAPWQSQVGSSLLVFYLIFFSILKYEMFLYRKRFEPTTCKEFQSLLPLVPLIFLWKNTLNNGARHTHPKLIPARPRIFVWGPRIQTANWALRTNPRPKIFIWVSRGGHVIFYVNFQVRTRISIMNLEAGQGLMGATAPTTNPTWVSVCETIIDLNPTNTLPNPPLIVAGQAGPVPI